MRDKSVSFDDQYDYGQAADSMPEKIQREEQAALIDRLLGYLNTDQRTCMVLRNIEGLSYEEIAEALKIPINTVRSRLKRAREKLLQIRNEVIPNEV